MAAAIKSHDHVVTREVVAISFPVFRILVERRSGGSDDVFSNKVYQVSLHLDGDVEKLVRVVSSSRTSSGCGIFGSSRSFIGILCLRADLVFLTLSATFHPQPTMLNSPVVIFVF